MTGQHRVTISTKRLCFDLCIERKVTVIKGNSSTGKSTLIGYIDSYLNNGKSSGVKINSPLKIGLLKGKDKDTWEKYLKEPGKIIFIDEDVRFIYSSEFQTSVAESDNYFVIISRSGKFKHMPYSINSIYEFVTRKNGSMFVTNLSNLYEDVKTDILPSLVITEDSNAGHDIMKIIFKGIPVESANGNGNVANKIKELGVGKCTYVIVDGAAFGGFIEEVYNLKDEYNLYIFTPESFEYMLLKTKLINKYVKDELEKTYDYNDISNWLTWERYYTYLLNTICILEFDFEYSKTKLHNKLKNKGIVDDIKSQLTDIDFSLLES